VRLLPLGLAACLNSCGLLLSLGDAAAALPPVPAAACAGFLSLRLLVPALLLVLDLLRGFVPALLLEGLLFFLGTPAAATAADDDGGLKPAFA
jgi:hypothetical protein